jgi:Putative MetA-pathway of phenol degradation
VHRINKVNGEKTEISGFSNLLIGSKVQFTNQELTGQDLGLLLQFYLPVGNTFFKPPKLEPEILMAYGKDLSQTFSWSANVGSHWNSDNENFIFMFSSSFGTSINNKWNSFIEIYGEISKDSKAVFGLDFGLSYLLLNNLQWDLSAGSESFKDLNNWFIGSGISIRLPH